MLDGIWHGLLGGLFGPMIARWMSQFKYWMIFLIPAVGWQIFFFCVAIWYRGWAGLYEVFIHDNSTFLITFVYAPVGVGLAAVFVAFLGSLNAPVKKEEYNSRK